MSMFWFEFLFFATAMFGILVAFASANLFYQTFKVEQQRNTAWRAIGFLLLVIALVLFIVERKYGSLGIAGLIVEACGFFFIYRGVLAQPRLSHLTKVQRAAARKNEPLLGTMGADLRRSFLWVLFKLDIIILVILAVLLVVWLISPASLGTIAAFASFLVPFIPSLIVLLSFIFILLTIRLQIRRYRGEDEDEQTRRNNLYPLIGYIFFAFRAIAMAGYRLPRIDLVWTRFFNGEYGSAWVIAAAATALGFLFLAFWAWRFIRVRFFLRTYVVFLALSIAVATAGVLIFSLLIFKVVETNNLDLMERGANTESLIMVERLNVAATMARLLAEDPCVVVGAAEFDVREVSERAEFFREQTNVDTIRFFSADGEVLASPTDPRDIGRVFGDDILLQTALEHNAATRSFEVMPGVLSPVVVARALYPIASGSVSTGMVEVGYLFDNAFVDYSKRETDLEVTVYSGRERAASTIRTADGTSRWVGSTEIDPDVVMEVLVYGNEYQTALDRLGVPYYSAFIPIRNSSEEIIGMLSVGVPTHVLLEETRQRLLSSFFMATLISFLAAIAGYYAFRNFNREAPVKLARK